MIKLFHPFIYPVSFKDPQSLLKDLEDKYETKEEVRCYTDELALGLSEFEQALINGPMRKRGFVLDVGCGAGREAISLTRLGFKVKAIDISSNMIKVAKGLAEKEELAIDFEKLCVTELDYENVFNYCLFSSEVYNSIPTKKLRMDVIRRVMHSLRPSGSCFIPIGIRRKRRFYARDTFVDTIRRLLKFFLKDRLKTDVGDALISETSPLSNVKVFHHFFFSFKEIEDELTSSGFMVKELKRGLWQLTRAVDTQTLPLNIGRNLILLYKSQEIIKEFSNNAVDSIILKGLYLAFNIYPDMGLRPMADIDMLVKQGDLKKIEEILIKLGYTEVSQKGQRKYRYSAVFCNKDKIYIDIRWDVCHAERFKGVINITKDFWKRAVEFSLDGVAAKTLSIEDHILYISLHHALIDLLQGTCGVWDLFYLLNKRKIDWDKVVNYADEYCIKAPVYYSLLKVSELTYLKLPDSVIEALKPNRIKKALIDYLLLKAKIMPLQYLCQALMMDTLSSTLRVLWQILRQSLKRINLAPH